MEKFNAQAERPSNRTGALRPSPANYGFLEQKHLATGPELHVPHVHFFYLFIDYKHKHTALASWIYALHLPPPPYVLNRLQAQAPRSDDPGHCDFFIDISENPI